MKIRTEINQKKNVTIHIVSGKFDVEALFELLTDMYNSLPMRADMNVLWDLRAADGIGLMASDQLNKVVGMVSETWGESRKKKAALVVSHQVNLGFTRLNQKQLQNQSPSKFRVFKDIKKAVRWIDQDTH